MLQASNHLYPARSPKKIPLRGKVRGIFLSCPSPLCAHTRCHLAITREKQMFPSLSHRAVDVPTAFSEGSKMATTTGDLYTMRHTSQAWKKTSPSQHKERGDRRPGTQQF
jgi:hypothetical protein